MATNPEELVSPRDAAREYGVSDRRLRQLADEGKLRREYAPRQAHQAKAPVFYRRADLEAWKAGAPNQHPTVALTPAADGTGAAVAKAAPKADSFERLLEWLASLDPKRALAAPPAPEPARWVSVEEAAAASGLSVSQVLRTAPLWEKRGEAIRGVRAKRADGGFDSCSGWKIRRAALDAPLPVV